MKKVIYIFSLILSLSLISCGYNEPYYYDGGDKNSTTSLNSSSSSVSYYCGAKTKSGGYCKRKVKGGGRCWQHK